MRIDKLSLPRYRNLRDFKIDFDESQATTVLLGRNGSGKSHLIEAIVEIFRELETGGVPSFPYMMEYVCHDQTIKIDADPARARNRLTITVDGKPLTQAAFRRDLYTYLPKYVFAYYSGWSSRLERHFDKPTREHYKAVLNARDNTLPLRRMFFCRKDYSQLVLLAFFLSRSPEVRILLEEYLDINSFESALFVLKRPWWYGGGGPRPAQREEGDPRFWYARGAFKGLLDRMWERALAPIRNNETIERDIRRQGEGTERLYLFIKDEDELGGLKKEGDEPKDLFGYLESLFLCDLIDEVRVRVKRKDGTRVKFTQMSEGEQQLLTVLGLLLFTQNDESLYLLDEPDTHLNPVWTYDFLQLLQKNIHTERGQLIVATHNPLMIGSLHKEQVRVLSTSAEDGQVTAQEPEYDPLGVGIEGLLKSELYGLRSTLAPEVLVKLDRHYQLLGREQLTDEEQEELRQIAQELNSLGVARTHPNPYFESFAMALARHAPTNATKMSAADIEVQTKLANELLDELLAERDEVGGSSL